jgi:hypothetical protein
MLYQLLPEVDLTPDDTDLIHRFTEYLKTCELIMIPRKQDLGKFVFLRDPYHASVMGTLTSVTRQSYTLTGQAIVTTGDIPETRTVYFDDIMYYLRAPDERITRAFVSLIRADYERQLKKGS